MYRKQVELHQKDDPYHGMIDVDRDLPKIILPEEELEYTTAMCSMAHTYGNVLAFVQKYILDLFPKNTFKTVHINSKIAHRQMIQTDLRAHSKKMNPKIIFRPRIAGFDEERFLKGTQFIERQTNILPLWGTSNMQSFMDDPEHGYHIRYLMNRSVMYIDVACVFSTLIQQINMSHALFNTMPENIHIPVQTCLESYIPLDLINLISNIINLPVVDKDGCTKAFMDYLNGHSRFPITYKLSGATGNREFYRYYPANVEIMLNDIQTDEGERTGQVMGSYQMNFTVRVEFESTGLYFAMGRKINQVRDSMLREDQFMDEDVVPVFTDINVKEDYNVAPGWHLYNQASCRLDKINDSICIMELLNDSIKRTIEYHAKNGLPCVEFMDIKIRRQGELLREGIDYMIDYRTMDIAFHNTTIYYTYKILVYINVQYINEMIKDLYHLS